MRGLRWLLLVLVLGGVCMTGASSASAAPAQVPVITPLEAVPFAPPDAFPAPFWYDDPPEEDDDKPNVVALILWKVQCQQADDPMTSGCLNLYAYDVEYGTEYYYEARLIFHVNHPGQNCGEFPEDCPAGPGTWLQERDADDGLTLVEEFTVADHDERLPVGEIVGQPMAYGDGVDEALTFEWFFHATTTPTILEPRTLLGVYQTPLDSGATINGSPEAAALVLYRNVGDGDGELCLVDAYHAGYVAPPETVTSVASQCHGIDWGSTDPEPSLFGETHLFTVTLSSTGMTLWLDGINQFSISTHNFDDARLAVCGTTTCPLTLGDVITADTSVRFADWDMAGIGSFHFVTVYDYVLTEDQIETHAIAGSTFDPYVDDPPDEVGPCPGVIGEDCEPLPTSTIVPPPPTVTLPPIDEPADVDTNQGLIDGLLNGIGTMFNWLGETLWSAISWLATTIGTLFDYLVDQLWAMSTWAVAQVGYLVGGAVSAITATMGAVVDAIVALGDLVIALPQLIIDLLVDTLTLLFVPQNGLEPLTLTLEAHETKFPLSWGAVALDGIENVGGAGTPGGGSSCGPVIDTSSVLPGDGGVTFRFPNPSTSGCPGNGPSGGRTDGDDMAGDLFGYRTPIRAVLAIALWLSVVWRLLGLAPWSKPGSTEAVAEGVAL